MSDKLQESIAQIVEGVQRRSQALDYRASYMGTIVSSTGDRCDVEMDDNNLFPQRLTSCRLLRPDGFTSLNPSGTRCYVFWSAHNPSLRYAEMAYDGNGTVDQIEQTAETSVTFLTPETIADKNLISEHEIGKSAGTLTTFPGVNVDSITAEGDDAAFEVTLIPADAKTPMGSILGSVSFGRAYDTAPKAVTQLNSYVTAPSAYDFKCVPFKDKVSFFGTFPNPTGETKFTVFVRGNKS